jgi:hypothetical protein
VKEIVERRDEKWDLILCRGQIVTLKRGVGKYKSRSLRSLRARTRASRMRSSAKVERR